MVRLIRSRYIGTTVRHPVWRQIKGSYVLYRSTGQPRVQAFLWAFKAWWRSPADRRRDVGRFHTGRPLMFVAAGLGVFVVAAFAYKLYFGVAPWESRPRPLPDVVRGGRLNSGVAPQGTGSIGSGEITVIDGDTITARRRTIRLVGFDTPEAGPLARCARERDLAQRASARLRALIAGGGLALRFVPCACPPSTEGTGKCNHGRACGTLTAHGRDVGTTMIQEGIARPYICGATSCPPRGSWC